jgi:diguanylate cyclase (GGDEF)-like protein/PAS domain S-box-containing protein
MAPLPPALAGALAMLAAGAALALLAGWRGRAKRRADARARAAEIDALQREQAGLAERLRLSEARLAAILEASLDPVLMIDGLGGVKDLSASARALFGCDERGRVTLTSLFAGELPIETARFGAAASEFETVARRPNRARFPVEVRVAPVRDPHVPGLHAIAVRDLTARRRFEQSLGALRFEDELTHAYTSTGFLMMATQQLKTAIRNAQSVVVLNVELDGLEEIRERFGPASRDRALVELATELRASFRETDVIGRLGDGQFAILATETTPHGVDRALERFSRRLANRNAEGDLPWALGASLGWWRVDPVQGLTLGDLLSRIHERLPEHRGHAPGPGPAPHAGPPARVSPFTRD